MTLPWPMALHMSPCGGRGLAQLKARTFRAVNLTRLTAARESRHLGGACRSRLRNLTCRSSSAPLANEGWPLWSALAACAAVSQVVEKRTPLGAVLSAPLVSMLVALCLAVLHIIPTSAPAFDTVWAYVMPLGAVLCLLEMPDLRRLWDTAASTLAAFLIGASGTVLGTLLAFWLLGSKLGPEGYKVAAALCASYIGGSINFAAVAQTLGLAPGHLLAGAMAADNLAMAAYIGIIMSIPAEDRASTSGVSKGGPAAGHNSSGSGGGRERNSNQPSAALLPGSVIAAGSGSEPAIGYSIGGAETPMTAESASLALAAAATACMLGNAIAGAVGFASSGLAVMALLAAGFAMLGSAVARWWSRSQGPMAPPFAGAEALGSALCLTFFATIGAGAGSLGALAGGGWLLAFISVQLSVHLLVIIGAGRLLRLPMRSILVASNANVGGSATAAAMASSKHWHDMAQPAVLTGSLGYAIATVIGTAVGHWLRTWRLGLA